MARGAAKAQAVNFRWRTVLLGSGARGDKIYARAYDPGGGRCVGEKRAARLLGPKRDVVRMRWHEKTEWRYGEGRG